MMNNVVFDLCLVNEKCQQKENPYQGKSHSSFFQGINKEQI